MAVGQAIIVAFIVGQAITVHLGQEAEMIGQSEIPDPKLDGQPERSPRRRTTQGQGAMMSAGVEAVWNVKFNVQALELGAGSRRRPGSQEGR